MKSKPIRLLGLGLLSLAGAAAAHAAPSQQEMLERMLSGRSVLQGKELESAIRTAENSPLGSEANPVRVSMPMGERAYLARLRCSDGNAPKFSRDGSFGGGPYGNILDGYSVTCAGGTPAASTVFMDMYHRGFAEQRPVPGFSIED